MRFSGVQPNKPRPLARVHVGVAPRMDARWRNVPAKRSRIDTVRRLEIQRKAR